MQCPNCRLENPPSAGICDCGYSFATGHVVAVPSENSTGMTSRYQALETVSTISRFLGWIGGIGLVVAGAAVLVNAPDPQRVYAIPVAIACVIYGGAVWLGCMFIAEGITLCVDVAKDVRVIASNSTRMKTKENAG